MEKPNWKELKKFHELLLELDRVFSVVLTDESRQEQEVRGAFAMSLKANAGRSLSHVPVDELKKSRAGKIEGRYSHGSTQRCRVRDPFGFGKCLGRTNLHR